MSLGKAMGQGGWFLRAQVRLWAEGVPKSQGKAMG